MEKIPIIILNYNSSADCRKCISFLKRQEGVELEIVLVDNCSRPDDVEWLHTLAREEGCTLLESKENRGYNAGNNIGLRYAVAQGYEYALIANPDMEFPQTDYVVRLVEAMKRDEDVVVVGSDIVTPAGCHQNPMREVKYWEELLWPVTMLRFRKKGEWFLGDYGKSGYCEKLSGCCLLIRVSFVEEIGYFDEATFLYSEEPILAKQVARRGFYLYYVADAKAVHRHVKSEKGDPRKRMEQLYISRGYYLRKYSGYPQWKLGLLGVSRRIEQILQGRFLEYGR